MKADKLAVDQNEKTALVLDPRDNVAVALTALKAGDRCIVRYEDRNEEIEVMEDIEFGHKVTLTSLGKDEPVLKYGEEIGKMKVPIGKGRWVHNHNMYCERGLK